MSRDDWPTHKRKAKQQKARRTRYGREPEHKTDQED